MAENSEPGQERQADRQEHGAWGRFPSKAWRRGSSEARRAEESIYDPQGFGWHGAGELGCSPPMRTRVSLSGGEGALREPSLNWSGKTRW